MSRTFLFRKIEELILRALDSCGAVGQKEAIQSLLEGRSLSVLASSSTGDPVDFLRVALAENFGVRSPLRRVAVLARWQAARRRPRVYVAAPQLNLLNEELEQRTALWTRN